MKKLKIFLVCLAILDLTQGFKVDESPEQCLEPETAEIDPEWLKKVSAEEGWHVALASKFLPPFEDAERTDNFLDHGESYSTECGRGWLKTPIGDKEVKFKCSFDKDNIEIRKCVISSASGSSEDAFIPFARTLRVTHTDNSTYIVLYGCTENEDKDKAQHMWMAVSTIHPPDEETREKILEAVDELGFNKSSHECSLSSKVAWRRFLTSDCEKPRNKGIHMHSTGPMPPDMPDYCLAPKAPKLNEEWIHEQRKKGWHIAMSSTEPPPHSFIRDPETYLDHGDDAVKDCGTAKLKTPLGDEFVRWECSLKENEHRKCVLRLGNTTGHSSTVAFSGSVHLSHTDNRNYVLLYGCMQNKQKTLSHHVWLAMTTKIPADDHVKERILDEVESLGFDPSSHYQCTLRSELVWTEFIQMTHCPDQREAAQGQGYAANNEETISACWTCESHEQD